MIERMEEHFSQLCNKRARCIAVDESTGKTNVISIEYTKEGAGKTVAISLQASVTYSMLCTTTTHKSTESAALTLTPQSITTDN